MFNLEGNPDLSDLQKLLYRRRPWNAASEFWIIAKIAQKADLERMEFGPEKDKRVSEILNFSEILKEALVQGM